MPLAVATLLSRSTLDFLTSRLLDFLTPSFVFINIPGLFLQFSQCWTSSAVPWWGTLEPGREPIDSRFVRVGRFSGAN